jgi:hypothetical protein
MILNFFWRYEPLVLRFLHGKWIDGFGNLSKRSEKVRGQVVDEHSLVR